MAFLPKLTAPKFKNCLGLYSLVIRSRRDTLNQSSFSNSLLIVCNYRSLYTGVKSTMEEAVGNRMKWNLTTDGIKKSADELIETHKKIWDSVGSVQLQDVSYDNVIKVNLKCYQK